METVKIYLSGGMSGLSFKEQNEWRTRVIGAIRFGDYNYEKKPLFFNPVDYYSFEEERHKSEKEIMEFDLYQLRNSDLVILNFNNPASIGTAMEVMLANELNIPIIAFGIKDDEDVHPWLLECCNRVCDNLRELIEHIVDFYLN